MTTEVPEQSYNLSESKEAQCNTVFYQIDKNGPGGI
jgi:hypothetical protein